ncbi:MAG TPA: LuxR C-terminal-related transcriptional regulator [Polyangiaceae bacterium]|nr:LuxR C-terminal-related transcriptional regulator [Polyangiaceae bacterium]
MPRELPPPRGLEAYTGTMGDEEIIVVGFDLPKISVPPGLSAAEEEIVRAIASGLQNAEIARQRGTSVRTVANQIASIFSKVGVGSRAELVYLCSRVE